MCEIISGKELLKILKENSQIIIECPNARHRYKLKHMLNKNKRIKHKRGVKL